MLKDLSSNNSLITHWTINLVGTSAIFSINLIISLIGGLLYTFKITQSIYILAFFGVVLPALFTFCLYGFIKDNSESILGNVVPKVFISRASNRLLMLFDVCLIIAFAVLIYFGTLNYFLFRFLQTVLFPCLLLIFLRTLFLSKMFDKFLDENN
ncbi:MAG TPA: hypothetical protein DIW31_02515 [Bacteroidales bacterium]|nr:hypothetical protein [Bacteroidales bacterium]